ncbi:MAG TPA: TonB-dependent receptor [Allosphingosinicella sp.]|jgi:iron complex outermembrane receptor protein
MRKFGLLGTSALRSIVIVGLGAAAGAPAFAQDTNTTGATRPVTSEDVQACNRLPTDAERAACVQAQGEPEATPEKAGDPSTQTPGENAERQAESDTIVVTGSRIRRSAFNSPDPLTVIDPELEQKSGRSETAEILQSSPVAAGSFQITSLLSAGSFVTNGGVGAQTLSLRGLGAERTLVLLNGRRAGPAGTRGSIAGFDLNVIPAAAIQSVEILKTGASSIYGSDAIAGVVNLLTRKATDGIDLRGFSSVPLGGGGEGYGISVAYGKEFSRGYIIGGVDYNHRNELERGDRDYLLCPEEFITNPQGQLADILDPRTGKPRCNASFTNALQISTQTLSPGITFGTIQFNNPGDRLNEFLPPPPRTATFGLPVGFYPVSFTCTAAALATSLELCRNSVGLNDPINPLVYGSTITPKLDRYTAYLDAGFNITDKIEVIGEFLYNRRQTESQNFRQLFFTQFSGQTIGTTSTARPAFQCTAARRATNPNCDPNSVGDPLNAGFIGNFFLTPVVGIPTSVSTDVQYYRGVGGVRADIGDLLKGWRFDSYVQYSRSDGDYTNSRVFQDAYELLDYRSRRCLPGQVTRVRGVPCLDINFTDPRVIAGNFTPQEQAFLFGNETGNTLYTQVTAEASVSGDLFTLPAGPIGAAFGIQYRRDEIDDTPGEITLANNVSQQSVSGRTAGFATSKEAFAELEVPLIHNTPFIQQLTLSAAARVVNSYAERDPDGANDRDKGNWTYKLGFNWQVNDWLRFRGSYGTSFRSPALFEQFLANQTGFQGQAAIDPCIRYAERVANGALSPQIGQRCQALGIAGDYSGAGTSSAVVSTGGGVGVLDPETSSARNVSIILNPRQGLWNGMRFSVAVDYFDIKVKGQVTTLGAGNILFTCFNSTNYPNDPTCSLFTRDTTPGSSRFGEIISVSNPFLNINSQRNRGIDLTARVTQDLGRHGTLSMLAQTTWQIEDRFELFAGAVADDNGESSDPIFVGDLKTTYTNGPVSVFYGLNVIGGTSDEQDLRDTRGGEICLTSALRGGLVCPVYKLKPQFYHSASVTIDIAKRFSMTMGVNNILNNTPPRVSGAFSPISSLGQVPVFGTQYDLIGRRAFVSFRAKM